MQLALDGQSLENKVVASIYDAFGDMTQLLLDQDPHRVYLFGTDLWYIDDLSFHDAWLASNLDFEFLANNNDASPIDYAFSHGSIGEWLTESSVEHLSTLMVKGGVFVCDTINKKPKAKPTTKKYNIADRRYVELEWSVGDRIHRVQVCEGEAPHVTSEDYIAPDKLDAMLSRRFAVHRTRDGNTDMYRCVNL